MYNLFKAIFGIPPNDDRGFRPDDDSPNDFRNNFRGINHDDDDDDDDDNSVRMPHEGSMGAFGFPIFSDPIEIHKYFDNLIDEMHKKFEMFGFHSGPSITWEEDRSSFSSQNPVEDSRRRSESLRDSYLKKPGYISDRNAKKEDVDLDGQIKVGEVENLLRKEQEPSNSAVQYSPPKVFSKSVYIRTIRRPDGTTETIKKVRDHTGNEETTITHDVSDATPGPPGGQPTSTIDDVPGMSILKKFFPF